MKICLYIIGTALLIPLIMACNRPRTTNYYFNPETGNDTLNPGTSPDLPFRSVAKLADLKLNPGDSVLLKSGAEFNEPVYVHCSGNQRQPIVIGKYGGKEMPRIKTRGHSPQAVHIFNSEHIYIRDLDISNKGDTKVTGLTGILVELKEFGTAHNVTLDNLYVHDVTGSVATDSTGGGSGIMIRNYRDNVEEPFLSRYDGLLVQNCLVKNCSRDGILMWGNWIRSKWYPSLNVVIRNNVLEGVPGYGIVPVGCLKPLIEYNVMKDCPDIMPHDAIADGIWPWACDSALIQFNTVSDMSGSVDGYGFDSDYDCKGSIFQYNLSYNNQGGFLLICNPGGWPPDWCTGNTGTIIRYNISINDGIREKRVDAHGQPYFSPVINITGPVKNTLIEKNLFILPKKKNSSIDRTLVHFTDWRGYADNTSFRNNYILSEEILIAWKPTKSTNSIAENNLFTGNLSADTEGFREMQNLFSSKAWFDSRDPGWKILVSFIEDKAVTINGNEIKVRDLLFLENSNYNSNKAF
ncbi:MAG TPA: right-handed parallel beta-helix repeat-containing protein [Bacteroidales bacterium]|nr:right-handed parallel beta-helix repeat-containing protein [Bacteroidales bacterium]